MASSFFSIVGLIEPQQETVWGLGQVFLGSFMFFKPGSVSFLAPALGVSFLFSPARRIHVSFPLSFHVLFMSLLCAHRSGP